MMHKRRVFTVKSHNSIEEMVERIWATESWTLCTGFQVGNILLLNDSIHEDSAQEFVIVVLDAGTFPCRSEMIEYFDRENFLYFDLNIQTVRGIQTESITLSWTTKERLIETIRQASTPTGESWEYPLTLRIDYSNSHLCPYCA